jgi:hypothetical protein
VRAAARSIISAASAYPNRDAARLARGLQGGGGVFVGSLCRGRMVAGCDIETRVPALSCGLRENPMRGTPLFAICRLVGRRTHQGVTKHHAGRIEPDEPGLLGGCEGPIEQLGPECVADKTRVAGARGGNKQRPPCVGRQRGQTRGQGM